MVEKANGHIKHATFLAYRQRKRAHENGLLERADSIKTEFRLAFLGIFLTFFIVLLTIRMAAQLFLFLIHEVINYWLQRYLYFSEFGIVVMTNQYPWFDRMFRLADYILTLCNPYFLVLFRFCSLFSFEFSVIKSAGTGLASLKVI